MGTVAVIIPAFNAGRFLGPALDSVFVQSRPPEEILVIDDGSSDDTVAIAARYPVRLLRHDRNRGPSAARNTAVAATGCDYLAFLDADDFWSPEHCAPLAAALDAHANVVLATARCWRSGPYEEAVPLGLPDRVPIDAFWTLLYANCVVQSGAMARRDALQRVGGYREETRFGEDYDLWLRLAREGPIVGIDHVSCYRRIHPAQLSNRIPGAIIGGAWEARFWAVRTLLAEGTREERERVGAVLLSAWIAELRLAARAHSRADLNALLALRDRIPGSERIARRWQRYRCVVWPIRRASIWVRDRFPRHESAPPFAAHGEAPPRALDAPE